MHCMSHERFQQCVGGPLEGSVCPCLVEVKDDPDSVPRKILNNFLQLGDIFFRIFTLIKRTISYTIGNQKFLLIINNAEDTKG
jgi:hypothetical protein